MFEIFILSQVNLMHSSLKHTHPRFPISAILPLVTSPKPSSHSARGWPGDSGHTARFEEEGSVSHLLNVAGGQVFYLWRMCVVSTAWPAPRRGQRRGIVSHLPCYLISMFRVQESVYKDGKQNRCIGKGYQFSFLIMEKLERGKKQSKWACALEREKCGLRVVVLCWPPKGLLFRSNREGHSYFEFQQRWELGWKGGWSW